MDQPLVYSAPLQSYTTVFLRAAYHQTFGGIDKYFTPFFEFDKQGHYAPRLFPELSEKLNAGMNLVPQVLTDNGHNLLAFAKQVSDFGYREINLNMGCPHPPVWRKGLGSGLIQKPKLLEAVLGDYFAAQPTCKLSIKMRLGVAEPHEWIPVIEVLNQYPLTEVIIHPRTAKQLYKGNPDWDEFEKLHHALTHPLVANGNIDSVAEFRKISVRFANVNKFMVGRGWLQNPWLPSTAKNNLENDEGNMAKLKQFHQYFYTLVLENVTDINIKRNLLHSFWFYLRQHLDDGARWYRSLTKERSLDSYQSKVADVLGRRWMYQIDQTT